jgi:hypothetical protein
MKTFECSNVLSLDVLSLGQGQVGMSTKYEVLMYNVYRLSIRKRQSKPGSGSHLVFDRAVCRVPSFQNQEMNGNGPGLPGHYLPLSLHATSWFIYFHREN